MHMRHRFTTALFEYWNRLRAGRPAPERSEIEPCDIRAILGDTFILEVTGPAENINFRLAGTRLCAACCRELKELDFLSLWNPQSRPRVRALVAETYRQNAAKFLSAVATSNTGRTAPFEAIILPLARSADGSVRMLGLMAPVSKPYWIGTEPIEYFELNAVGKPVTENSTGPNMQPRNWQKHPPAYVPRLRVDNVGKSLSNQKQSASFSSRQVQHLTVHDGGKEPA